MDKIRQPVKWTQPSSPTADVMQTWSNRSQIALLINQQQTQLCCTKTCTGSVKSRGALSLQPTTVRYLKKFFSWIETFELYMEFVDGVLCVLLEVQIQQPVYSWRHPAQTILSHEWARTPAKSRFTCLIPGRHSWTKHEVKHELKIILRTVSSIKWVYVTANALRAIQWRTHLLSFRQTTAERWSK